MANFRSKEDNVIRLSKSVFVSNFPDDFGSRDLWNLCQTYGKVVDVFIPNRKSKSGKRFGFVRFIKVGDMDRLINNLRMLWVGRFHLQFNNVRYERPSLNKTCPPVHKPSFVSLNSRVSYANVASGPNTSNRFAVLDKPSLVLDDDCGLVGDFSRHVLGKHVGVNSWFQTLHLVTLDFVSTERIAWVDVEDEGMSDDEEEDNLDFLNDHVVADEGVVLSVTDSPYRE
nr:hypothetical protein [Tanacetum cinerariifolium]